MQRDLWRGVLATVAVGTGTRAESESDTSLQTQIVTKPAGLENKSVGEVVARGRLTTADVNGTLLTEVGVQDANGAMLTRRTYLPLEKNETIEVEYEILYRVRNA
jgi:hypothetical protein